MRAMDGGGGAGADRRRHRREQVKGVLVFLVLLVLLQMACNWAAPRLERAARCLDRAPGREPVLIELWRCERLQAPPTANGPVAEGQDRVQRLFDDDDWQFNPEHRQELTPEHRRFMCNLSMLDGDDRLDLVVTRGEENLQGTAGLPSLVGYGAIGGNNAGTPVLVAKAQSLVRIVSGDLTFIELPRGGANMLTIHPFRPPGAPRGTFWANYTRHMIAVSHWAGECTAVGARLAP